MSHPTHPPHNLPNHISTRPRKKERLYVLREVAKSKQLAQLLQSILQRLIESMDEY